MESSIRDFFIFWNLSWGMENDNTLLKKSVDLELNTKDWPWPIYNYIYIYVCVCVPLNLATAGVW